MSEQQPPEGERLERVEIVYELPLSAQGTYEYEREDGTPCTAMRAASGHSTRAGTLRTSCSSRLHVGWGTGRRPDSGHPPPREVLGRWGLLARGHRQVCGFFFARTRARVGGSTRVLPPPRTSSSGRGLDAGRTRSKGVTVPHPRERVGRGGPGCPRTTPRVARLLASVGYIDVVCVSMVDSLSTPVIQPSIFCAISSQPSAAIMRCGRPANSM
jgi:hypothetical protein